MPFPSDLPPHFLALARQLKLRPTDVEERFIRGAGRGGQKINKTSSTVQLRHGPSGIEIRAQQFREQSNNRIAAWKRLILKLEEKEKGKESRRAKAIFKLQKQKQRRSRRSKEKMLEAKHHRADIKEGRKKVL